jgi:hypothetical protein
LLFFMESPRLLTKSSSSVAFSSLGGTNSKW